MTALGQPPQQKTVTRKVSAVIRVRSPLPDYLYEGEIETLYQVASAVLRTYLLVLLSRDGHEMQ